MRFASRLLRRTDCLAPATPADLIERGLEAARDVVEAAVEAVDVAPAVRSHRGRTAVTVAAVTATALVATAAYVWWRRREPVMAAPTDSAPPPRATVPDADEPHTEAVVDRVDVPTLVTAPREAPIVVSFAGVEPEQCADGRRATPQPSVAGGMPASSRPPVAGGRFAMPGVRGVVLPGGGGALP